MRASSDRGASVRNEAAPEAAWPNSDLEAVASCPVCRSVERECLHRGLTDRVFFCTPDAWDMYRCRDCGSAYLDPRPTPESIGRAYVRYYTHGGGWRPSQENLSPLRRQLRALSNGYFNYRFGTRFVPDSSAGRWMAAVAPLRRADLESTGRHLPKPKPGQSLLDVGCGNGMFLDFAKQAGWQVSGVDFDANAVAFCVAQGLDVRQGGIDVLAAQANRFDWITLSHVLEHVHEPAAMLAACYRLLKPGGGVWVEVPNVDSLGHRRFGAAWRGLEPPRHLVLFNRQSLIRVLGAAGFVGIADAPFRPTYQNMAVKSQAIANLQDPYRLASSSKFSARSILADFRAWRDPGLREFVTLKAKKPE